MIVLWLVLGWEAGYQRCISVTLALPTIWISHGTGKRMQPGDAYVVYRDH